MNLAVAEGQEQDEKSGLLRAANATNSSRASGGCNRPHDETGVPLTSFDDVPFHVLVDRRLLGRGEPGAHVDALGATVSPRTTGKVCASR